MSNDAAVDLSKFFQEEMSDVSRSRLIIQARAGHPLSVKNIFKKEKPLHSFPSESRKAYWIKLESPEKADLSFDTLCLDPELIVTKCRPMRQLPSTKTLVSLGVQLHNRAKVQRMANFTFSKVRDLCLHKFESVKDAMIAYMTDDTYAFLSSKEVNSADSEVDNVLLIVENVTASLSVIDCKTFFSNFGDILKIGQNPEQTMYAVKFKNVLAAYEAASSYNVRKGNARGFNKNFKRAVVKIELEGFHLNLWASKEETASVSLPHHPQQRDTVSKISVNYLQIFCLGNSMDYSLEILDMLRSEGVFRVIRKETTIDELNSAILHCTDQGSKMAFIINPDHAKSRTVTLLHLDRTQIAKEDLTVNQAIFKVKQSFIRCDIPSHMKPLLDGWSTSQNLRVEDYDELIKFMLEYREKRIAADFSGNVPARFLSPPLVLPEEDPVLKAKKEDVQTVMLNVLNNMN